MTVDELFARARATLPHRPALAEALHAQARGALLVDIRGDDQRRNRLIPGAIVVPRNSLEWRCDPASRWRHPAITRPDLHIILVCQQGFQSSLAAATLQQLGLIHATDLDGGFTAWAAAGLPVIAPPAADQDHPVTVTLTEPGAQRGFAMRCELVARVASVPRDRTAVMRARLRVLSRFRRLYRRWGPRWAAVIL